MEGEAERRRALLHLALLWRLPTGKARCVRASPVILSGCPPSWLEGED